ncbi:MAG: hypothetical protein ACKPBA_06565 [Planctomycetota bacterium]
MLRTIALKEYRELLRDGRFRWAGGIVAGLLLVAGLAGFTAWREQAAQRDAAQATMQATWFNQPPKNPHSAAHYGCGRSSRRCRWRSWIAAWIHTRARRRGSRRIA